MNKKLLPAISIGIAVLLIGSVAYAADRRKNTKHSNLLGDKTREEEALKAELLGNYEHHEKKAQGSVDNKKGIAILRDDNKETALLAEVMNK